MFCEKCGSLLKPFEGKMQCVSCGTSKDEGLIRDRKKKEKTVEVVEEHESYPIIDADCRKCNSSKAYHWSIQTRSSDEPETQFFKCVKCRNTWREY